MLNNLSNENISEINLSDNTYQNIINLFVFAIGYEERSIYLFNEYFNHPYISKIGFLFKDYNKYENAKKNRAIILETDITPIEVDYSDYETIIGEIKHKINQLTKDETQLNIHIDYSSMPRSWYCQIALQISGLVHKGTKVHFWYSQGSYERELESWPSAGINDFSVFAGRASLRPINNRSHILGVGFDNIRAQAICSVLDPSYLVTTYSHSSGDTKMCDKILAINKDLVSSSAYTVVLPIDDFLFSKSKLCEVVNELIPKGDVVLVPDGPKTQVLVSSIIPLVINKPGVVCLHVKRHDGCYEAINVKPTGKVFGFSFKEN